MTGEPDDGGRVVPISPREVVESTVTRIPDDIIETVNEMLKEKATGSSTIYCTLLQSDIIERLEKLGYTSEELFANHFMDFEPVFRAVGWKVEYDRPGYCETYAAKFIFNADLK